MSSVGDKQALRVGRPRVDAGQADLLGPADLDGLRAGLSGPAGRPASRLRAALCTGPLSVSLAALSFRLTSRLGSRGHWGRACGTLLGWRPAVRAAFTTTPGEAVMLRCGALGGRAVEETDGQDRRRR